MLFRDERRQKILQMADVIVDGKRKKLAKLKAKSNLGEVARDESELSPNDVGKDEVIREELAKLDDLVTPKDTAYVQLFTCKCQ